MRLLLAIVRLLSMRPTALGARVLPRKSLSSLGGRLTRLRAHTPTVDPYDPVLVQATALLEERPIDLTEEQRQYYLQYLAFYGCVCAVRVRRRSDSPHCY